MTGKTITIHVEPDSELGRALAEADEREIVLERNGKRYRVEPAPRLDIADPTDIWAGYDPERLRETIERFAGTLSDQEAEEIKELIYRAREEGTRPPDRP